MRHAILAAGWCLMLWMTAAAAAARADEAWALTTADFHRSLGALKGIDGAGAHLAPSGGGAEIVVPLDRLLRADHGGRGNASVAAASAKFTLYLQNGDRLAGEPGALKDDVLAWNSPVVGEVQWPVQQLRALLRGGAAAGGINDERKEDQVVLANRDVVRGAVVGMEGGTVSVQNGADVVPLDASAVEAVLFAGPGKPAASAERAWRVRFVDGSVLTVPTVGAGGGKLTFELPAAKNATSNRSADLANVLSVEQVNGPVSWLSDRAPKVNEQVPFNAEGTYPARMDQSVFGKPLRVGGQTFDKGIGVHANSRLTFALDGKYKLFRTRYAIDTGGEVGDADVNVRILLDGKVVHEQKDVRAYKTSPVVTVELGDAKELTLEVTAAGVIDAQDRLDWIEPALVRDGNGAAPEAEKPATPAAPAATDGTTGTK
jgi:hypothetical protein